MTSTTSAGTKLAISAALPATEDNTGYAALTYTVVGGIESIPPFGPDVGTNSFQPLDGPLEKHKGTVNYGTITIAAALDRADAGQTLLRTAAAVGNNALYSVKVTLTNGDVEYSQGRAFGFQINVGSATNVLMLNTKIELSKKIVEVPGT